MHPEKYLKYLNHEVNRKEEEEFYSFLNENPESEKEFLEVKKLWDVTNISNKKVSLVKKRKLFDDLWKRKNKSQTKRNRKIYRIIKIAALFLLIIGLPFFYYLGTNSVLSNSERLTTTINCAFGDKSFIVLADSTEVWINSGSKLAICNNFGEEKRQVYLDGEAFFSVTKNKKIPFIIKTKDIDVQVLGTEFNLKAYSDESEVTTTLIKGSLKIENKSFSKIIKPNQKLVYNKYSQKNMLLLLSDTSPETEWKDGRLVFRNESLEELEFKLERWFDVDIEFADEQVKRRRFTGILERESILETISYFGISKYVDYKIEGNKIVFFSQRKK